MLVHIIHEFGDKWAILSGSPLGLRKLFYIFQNLFFNDGKILFFMQLILELGQLRERSGRKVGAQGDNEIIRELQEKILAGYSC